MASPDAHEPTLPTGRKSEFGAAEWRTCSFSTEVKSTGARFGARDLTARPTGRWSRRALRCRRPTAALRHHPCPWCSSVFWSACSSCSKHAATVTRHPRPYPIRQWNSGKTWRAADGRAPTGHPRCGQTRGGRGLGQQAMEPRAAIALAG
jgi:hypothetical protein